MSVDADKVIQTLIKTELLHVRPGPDRTVQPVVAISRTFGAGGRKLGTRLAQRLGVPFYDKEILEAVAERAKVRPDLMEKLDERIRSGADAWLYNVISGQNAFVTTYRHHLVNVLLAIARQGGVILGRGAHIVLAKQGAFRVHMVASEATCAERIAQREGIDIAAAAKRHRKVTAERTEYLRTTFGEPFERPRDFDLTINSDRLCRWDELVEVVIEAMAVAGLPCHREPGGG